MADVPLQVISDYASSERRITPSWTISQLKAKLEHITGIPLLSSALPQGLSRVVDTRPPAARPNFTDTSGVERYVMPEEEYEKKTDSVLAWKKAQKLGRFDPNAPSREAAKVAALNQELTQRGIEVGKRCRVGGEDSRRGVVKYVGEVKEIPGGDGPWIGIHLDEPVGKNDGSIEGTRYWGESSALKHGLFVRPEKVEVGDYPVLDDLEDMEEI
ncbi:Cell polarity protein alp11 [Cladobotryum mycophilum]|uniref:Cell polarity protein alp11 n=1 Tax=Cladobotryum mycophilum TaxID=491253 RepID=A0ABR0SZ37_9HYPO